MCEKIMHDNRANFRSEHDMRQIRTPQTRMALSPSDRFDSGFHNEELSQYFDRNSRFPESPVNVERTGMHSGKGPLSFRRSDERLREVVCDRLTDDPFIDATDIEVEVNNCEVVLKGTVDNMDARRRTEDIVDGINGVVHVANCLRLRNR
jgi:hypothetical protein